MKIKNRSVLITGGASGIGAAMVRTFRKDRYMVVFTDINAAAGREMKAEGVFFFKRDVRVFEDCELLMSNVVYNACIRSLDVLIANVGKNDGLSTDEVHVHEWKSSIELNLHSVFNTVKAALPYLQDYARIILVSSLVGMVGQKGSLPYTAAKSAIIGMAKTLALDLAPKGITVNALCPHAVETPMLHTWAASQPDGEEKTLERLRLPIPLGRFVQPEEVAAGALFLASEGAKSITGTTLLMNGGASLGC